MIGVHLLKKTRLNAGLTQSECARLAGVSYQTIQLLESGRGNPTLEVLESVSRVLGYEIGFKATAFDWAELVPYGLPLMVEGGSDPVSWEDFADKIQKAVLAVTVEGEQMSRERMALVALLVALRDHYPSRFRRYFGGNFVENWLKKESISGKVIRLRRLALERLGRLL